MFALHVDALAGTQSLRQWEIPEGLGIEIAVKAKWAIGLIGKQPVAPLPDGWTGQPALVAEEYLQREKSSWEGVRRISELYRRVRFWGISTMPHWILRRVYSASCRQAPFDQLFHQERWLVRF
jgi:hypothetical protein